jgi:hypothetical protein
VYPLLSWVSYVMDVFVIVTRDVIQVNWYREKRAREKNRRPNLIPRSTKHMVSNQSPCNVHRYLFSRMLQVFFSGLRGAVAYACANIFPDTNHNRFTKKSYFVYHCINNIVCHSLREVVICTTMVIALITIFIKGGFTIKMLELLGIQRGVDPGPYVEKVWASNAELSST